MVFKRCSIGTKGPKVYQENIPTPLHHHHQPEPLRQGRMDPCFYVLYAKFWPYHLNVAAEIETHQTRQRFSNLLLSNFGDPVSLDQQFLKYSDQPVWRQKPFHIQSHINPLSYPFWCSIWTSASFFTTYRCLNALSCCHVIGWLAICVTKQLNRCT